MTLEERMALARNQLQEAIVTLDERCWHRAQELACSAVLLISLRNAEAAEGESDS